MALIRFNACSAILKGKVLHEARLVWTVDLPLLKFTLVLCKISQSFEGEKISRAAINTHTNNLLFMVEFPSFTQHRDSVYPGTADLSIHEIQTLPIFLQFLFSTMHLNSFQLQMGVTSGNYGVQIVGHNKSQRFITGRYRKSDGVPTGIPCTCPPIRSTSVNTQISSPPHLVNYHY